MPFASTAQRAWMGADKPETADPTAASLKKVTEGEDYELVSGVPVFDEHAQYDAQGKLVRRYSRATLQEIAERTNARAAETGDLVPIGPGHTIDLAPENMQPPHWAYAKNFRVGTFGPQNKTALLADFLVHKDKKAELLTYPRRSIELWNSANFIDFIALLRRAPARDLGLLLTFSRETGLSALPPDPPVFYDSAHKRPLAARLSPGGKLRYSMEANVSDTPTTPPCPEGVDADFHKMFSACMGQFMGELKKYAAGPGFGGSPGYVPTTNTAPAAKPPEMDEEKVRLQKEADLIRFSRLEQQVAQMQQQTTRARAESTVKGLLYEGMILDVSAEVDEFARLDEDGTSRRCDYIRKYYRKDPTGGPWLMTQSEASPRETSPEERNQAVRLATERGVSYDEALRTVKAS